MERTQYCWVDFEQRWSLAHTDERMQRCKEDPKYYENGAMYLESMLRNVDFDKLMEAWGNEFMTGIGDPVRGLGGNTFMDEIIGFKQQIPVDQEAKYWRSKGIRTYQLQFFNGRQIGIVDKVEIVNALGMKSTWTIKQLENAERLALQTTLRMYWGPVNDWWAVGVGNTKIGGKSLVREAANHYGKGPVAWAMEQIYANDGVVTMPLTPQDTLWRQHIGPFGSIDMFWTMYPSDLFRLWQVVHEIVHTRALSSADAANALLAIPTESLLQTSPMVWSDGTNWMFMGGNPLCSSTAQLPYVVQMIRFDDFCNIGFQEAAMFTRSAVLFAYLASTSGQLNANATSICQSGTTKTASCEAYFTAAHSFASTFLTAEDFEAIAQLTMTVETQILEMNISLMQYAVRPSKESEETALLVEPVLSPNATTASVWHPFFGWLYLSEWVQGTREVISFEGDQGSIRLISGISFVATAATNQAEIVQSMSLYFQRGVQYVTIVFLSIATMALLYAIANTGRISGWNLLDFNRVAGTVWVGRPLLLLRGLVAISILSTSRLLLQSKFNSTVSLMEETLQSFLTTILNAGEAAWLVYVANDILMVFSREYTNRYARLCSLTVWTTVAILQLASPIHHRVTIEPKCEYGEPDTQVTCISGTIYIGSLERLLVCCQPRERRIGCKLLLPGIAQEMFSSNGWTHHCDWFLDPASAVIAGLITIRMCGISGVLDVKSWSFLNVRHGRIVEGRVQEAKATDRPQHLEHAIHLTTYTKAD